MKNLFQFNIKTLKSDSDILSDPKNNFFQTFHIDKNDSFPSFLIDLNTKNTYFSDQRQQNLEEKEQNISSYNSILDENKKILKIRQKNGIFLIYSSFFHFYFSYCLFLDHCFIVPTDKSAKNLVWRVLNKGSKDYFLQENDVVKLGNGQFKILCVFNFRFLLFFNILFFQMQMIKRESSSTEYYAYNSLSHSKTSSFFNISTPEDKSFIGNEERKKIVCRFCNSDEISMNNILIRPCECRSYIHLQCYRTFLQKSMKAQYIIDSSVIIENDSLVCENCMKNQMLVMNFCNAKKDLLDLQCFLQYMIIEKNDGQTLIINLDRHKDIFFVI